MPDWEELLRRIFSTLTGDPDELFKSSTQLFNSGGGRVVHPAEYLRLAQQFELRRERLNRDRGLRGLQSIPSIHEQVQHALAEIYDADRARNVVIGTHFMNSSSGPLPVWVTTNFDTFLEDTLFADGISSGYDAVLSRPIRNVDFGAPAGGGRTLLKMHGSVSNSRPEQSIVITEEDYHRFLRQDSYITNKLYTLFCERTVVFLGYSLSDPNIQFIYHEVLFDQKAGGTPSSSESFSQIRPSLFVSKNQIPEDQKAYYRHKRIQYLENYSIEQFFAELNETHRAFEEGKADITSRIRQNQGVYIELYRTIDWDTEPALLPIADEARTEYLSQLFDLIRLSEVVYRGGASTTPIDGFEPQRLSGTVQGALKVAYAWCREGLETRRVTLFEMLYKFVQVDLRLRKSTVLRSILSQIAELLAEFNGVPDFDRLLQRYCGFVFQYDNVYNDWDDYTFCLEHYVRVTRLFQFMARPVQSRIVQGLYRQLRMCGRDRGDSWYTTNQVYFVWTQFNVEAWPMLEAEIKKQGVDWKDQEILSHLRPGGDVREFFPR